MTRFTNTFARGQLGWFAALLLGVGATLSCTDSLTQPENLQSLIAFEVITHDPPTHGGEGCTPGFWKTRPHQDDWPPTGFSQNDLYDGVFGVNNLIGGGLTLLQSVGLRGNSYNSFIRHSVAALLNASHPDVAYDLSPTEVIAIVQAAHASGDFSTAKNQLQGLNELDCTIG